MAELDGGFKHVKEAAIAMIPAQQERAQQQANSQAAGPDSLGVISEEFESRGDPSAIGFDKTGGWSYGKYQIASRKGRFAEFIGFLATPFPPLKSILDNGGGDAAARAGTDAFKQLWRSLKTRPDFVPAQHAYIKATHYDVMVGKLSGVLNVNARSLALQNVVWSVAVQHGPHSGLIKIAIAGAADDRAMINAIYDERSKVDKYFKNSTADIKKAVLNRFQRGAKIGFEHAGSGLTSGHSACKNRLCPALPLLAGNTRQRSSRNAGCVTFPPAR